MISPLSKNPDHIQYLCSQLDIGTPEQKLSRVYGGVIEHDSVTASYHCILSDWVNWLMYNVGRCFDLEDADQRATGEKQIDYALSTLQRIMDHVPGLLSVSNP